MTFDSAARALMLRRLRFAALNATAAVVVVVLVIAPLASQVADQAEEITDRAELLTRLKMIAGEATRLRMNLGTADDPYLPGSEERLASADLQAALKTVAAEAGLRFLGVRGVTPSRPMGPRMVAVGLELEGPPAALRAALQKIETGRPMLFVTALVMRPAPGADEDTLRAEITVQGALRDAGTHAAKAEPHR